MQTESASSTSAAKTKPFIKKARSDSRLKSKAIRSKKLLKPKSESKLSKAMRAVNTVKRVKSKPIKEKFIRRKSISNALQLKETNKLVQSITICGGHQEDRNVKRILSVNDAMLKFQD